MAGSIHTIRKNTEALVIISKEITLELNAEKTKYVVKFRDQNAGKNGKVQVGNKSFETVEQFNYFGTTLTNQNSVHEKLKSSLKSGNSCCHSVQSLFSSSVMSKNTKIKVHRTVMLLFFVWV